MPEVLHGRIRGAGIYLRGGDAAGGALVRNLRKRAFSPDRDNSESCMTWCKHCSIDSATMSWQAERIEVLEESLRQAETRAHGEPDRFRRVGLAPSEHAILSLLLTRDLVSRRALYEALPTQAPMGERIVQVVICALRKKLRLLGLEIHCTWGVGYFIPREQRSAALAEFCVAA